MTHFERIAEGIDTSAIRAVLADHPDLWTGKPLPLAARHIECNTRRGDLSVDGKTISGWEGLFLRWPATSADIDHRACEPAIEAIALWARETLCTALRLTGARQVGCVALFSLKASACIPEHADAEVYRDPVSRWHLPIITNPSCWIESGGERVHMAAGDLWWFDHAARHSCGNDGTSDRVHLIIDVISELRSAA